MGDAGAVINDRRLQLGQCSRDRLPIEQIERSPDDARVGREICLPTTDVSPCRDRRLVLEQVIDEMAAGKASGARDQRRTRHGRQSDATLSVLRVVVGAKRRVVLFDRTPPPFVLSIPRHGVAQSGLE